MAIVLIFLIITVAFFIYKKLKGMIDMYFTDTPELRKFEREMQQKPNFYRCNDNCDENDEAHFSDNKKLKTDRKKKDGG